MTIVAILIREGVGACEGINAGCGMLNAGLFGLLGAHICNSIATGLVTAASHMM